MHFARTISSLAMAMAACASLTMAQSTAQQTINDGIADVLLNLQGAKVIPNLIQESDLALHGLLVQTFGSKNVSLGQTASVADVANVPTWSVEYSSAANTSGQFSSTRYTVMTLDPGAASEQPRNVVRHYLANNVTLSPSTGQLHNATKPIAGWFSPAPPVGSGVHRYVTLVFSQPANFTLPSDLQSRVEEIDTNFNLSDYVQKTGLGQIVAASFFLTQNDDSSASVTATGVVSTSAVPSASVAAVASSVSTSLAAAYSSGSSAPGGGSNGAAGSLAVSQTGLALLSTALFVAMGAFTL